MNPLARLKRTKAVHTLFALSICDQKSLLLAHWLVTTRCVKQVRDQCIGASGSEIAKSDVNREYQAEQIDKAVSLYLT